jgi:ABC-2 type transport system permease protein
MWMWFQESTNKGITLVEQKRYLLDSIQINKLDIYYASLLSTFLGFLFNFCAYFVCSLFFDIRISGLVVLLPLLVLNMAVFIIAVKIILSIVHVFIRDITHVWALAVLMLFWLSGILFEVNPDATWKTAILAYLTPILGILNNARAVLIYGEGFDWGLFVYDWGYAVVLVLVALGMMKRYFGRAMEIL